MTISLMKTCHDNFYNTYSTTKLDVEYIFKLDNI